MRALLEEAQLDRRIQHVVKHIQENRCANMTELSRLVNLSTSHLGRLFKAAMGTSIVQYTIELRLKDARQLLQTTDWPVKRIAIECGIPDGPNFVRLFKRRFRMTPSECRNNHRDEPLRPSEDDEAGDNTL